MDKKHFLFVVSSDRTKDKIYENLRGSMCFRRLNSTHQTGCSCKNSYNIYFMLNH